MELDLQTKQELANLLAQPATVTHAHAPMLSRLVAAYPYYQPLHLLLAKAHIGHANHQQSLANAALYHNGHLLHQVLYSPENLAQLPANLISAIKADKNAEQITDEQETFEEIAELNLRSQLDADQQSDEDVFDEIAEVDPAFIAADLQEPTNVAEHDTAETLPDEIAIENIVATDFFAFEKSFNTEQVAVEEKEKPAVPLVEEYDQEAEAQTVSKYDDDKLPYTFLWWLAKTRKEHEQIFQPYVTKKTPTAPQHNELQQQYVEHIFHLQTPFNVAEEASRGPVNKVATTKGADIIDNFIKNEPQIRAPKPEQINNENKAKQSAEDHNDLVSETLAAIYIEQMLYHKAIDTYEKLSLKFPEKSRYFADLIQSLEKKI